MNSVKEESGRAYVSIEIHVLHHLANGGEDAKAGVAFLGFFASRVARIRIQVVIAVGRSRVPEAVTAVSEVQYAARVLLEVTLQVFLHLKQRPCELRSR